MLRILSLAAAAALSTSLLASPAFAEGASVDVSGSADGSASAGTTGAGASGSADAGATAQADGNGTNIDTGATASTNADANFGLLISSIRATGDTSAQIEGMTDVSGVNVVETSTLIQGNNEVALENAVEENQTAIEELRASIEANQDLSAELQEEGLADLSAVVAATVNADGTVTVYTQ